MDVQEITAKVTALVKKHPYLAGAAILLVVVLGYLGYKKAGAGGSADSAPVDTSVSQDFGSGGSGGSGETGTSTLPSDLFSQLYPTQQAEPAQVDTSGGGNFGGGGNVNPADFGGSYVPPAGSGYIPYSHQVGQTGTTVRLVCWRAGLRRFACLRLVCWWVGKKPGYSRIRSGRYFWKFIGKYRQVWMVTCPALREGTELYRLDWLSVLRKWLP